MNKTLKKLFCITLLFMCLFQISFPLIANASTSTYKKYIVLGDSIAYGYGLSNKNLESYSSILRDKLNISNNNYKNLAISGLTCENFYKTIQTSEYTSAIKSADLITISIGSNELLQLAVNALAEATNVDPNDKDFLTKIQKSFENSSLLEKASMLNNVYNFFTSEETKQKINASIISYSKYWQQSVQYIKEINPNVTIVATQFYNPYYELQILSYDLGGFVDEAIVQMNTILEKQSDSEKNYKIAKIYSDFNTTNPRLTNVNINILKSQFNLDPHPNIYGHKQIANRILDSLKASESNKIDISKLTISTIKDQYYTGKELEPSITIKNGNYTLVENTDYTIVYIDNTNIGLSKIKITGIGNYSGSIIKTFNIKETERIDISKQSISSISDQTYTGIKITPSVEIKNGDSTLIQGKDYILTYQNNIDVGTSKIIITGIGNYSGSAEKNFQIKPINIDKVYVKDILDQLYTGSDIDPSIEITNGSIKLQKDKDFTLKYSNNLNVGIASIEITGKNNYTGTITKKFNIIQNPIISKKDIKNISCSKIIDKTYTGKLITPEVTLTDDDYILIKNKDYTLSYTDNFNIGTGKLIITGIGNYSGTLEKNFNIIKKNISYTFLDDISDQQYTGSQITPEITVTSDYIKLTEGQDYTIKFSNNTSIGTATITIEGINNYTGITTKTFNIIENLNNNTKDTDSELPNNKDTSLSSKILPYTGSKVIILILSLVILGTSLGITIHKIKVYKF